jgi:ABC-type transport system involved in multi-copper enzyme maturation permease subunit
MDTLRRIKAIIKIEWTKLLARKITLILPLITVGFVLLTGYGFKLGVSTRFIGIESGFYLASTTINTGLYLLTILTIVIVATTVGNEFVAGTIRYVLARPIKREEWLLGNLSALVLIVTILYLIIIFTGVIIGAITYGYHPLMEKEFVIHSQRELLNKFIVAIFLPLLPLITLVVAIELITLLTESPGAAIGITLGSGFALSLLSNQANWGQFFWANYIFSPLEEMERMAKGLPTDWESIIPWSVGNSIITGLILLGISLWIMRRKEILV